MMDFSLKNEAKTQETYGSTGELIETQPLVFRGFPSDSNGYPVQILKSDSLNKNNGWKNINSHRFVTVVAVVATVLCTVQNFFIWVTPALSPLVKDVINYNTSPEYIDSVMLLLENTMIPSSLLTTDASTADVFNNNREESSSPLVYMNQSEAYDMLWSSTNQHYFAYQTGLDVQKNQAYCAVASVTAVLNSLRVNISIPAVASSGFDLPTDIIYNPFPYATQTNIFNACTNTTVIQKRNTDDANNHVMESDSIMDGILTLPYGLTLRQVSGLLQCHLLSPQYNVTVYPATPSPISPMVPDDEKYRKQMRSIMIDAVSKARSRLIINYNREWLGQGTGISGGHFSPIGAYNEERDSFLILDVAKYKFPPVWATFDQIYHAMSTIDSCGVWNWPTAQAIALPEDLKRGQPPSSVEQYEAMKQSLGCTPTYRGFIVIEERSSV